jgi:hypothetical protein
MTCESVTDDYTEDEDYSFFLGGINLDIIAIRMAASGSSQPVSSHLTAAFLLIGGKRYSKKDAFGRGATHQ